MFLHVTPRSRHLLLHRSYWIYFINPSFTHTNARLDCSTWNKFLSELHATWACRCFDANGGMEYSILSAIPVVWAAQWRRCVKAAAVKRYPVEETADVQRNPCNCAYPNLKPFQHLVRVHISILTIWIPQCQVYDKSNMWGGLLVLHSSPHHQPPMGLSLQGWTSLLEMISSPSRAKIGVFAWGNFKSLTSPWVILLLY